MCPRNYKHIHCWEKNLHQGYHHNSTFRLWMRFLLNWMINKCDTVTCNDAELKQSLENEYLVSLSILETTHPFNPLKSLCRYCIKQHIFNKVPKPIKYLYLYLLPHKGLLMNSFVPIQFIRIKKYIGNNQNSWLDLRS